MHGLCRFLTHYFETDKGPFRNICDLSDEQIEFIIETEKGAETAFNRFARLRETGTKIMCKPTAKRK
jgi:hypothetical protein